LKRLTRFCNASLYTCLQILRVCKNTDFMRLAANYLYPHLHCHANRLILFDIYPDTNVAAYLLQQISMNIHDVE
jgi:hypothetical protein